MSNESKQTPYRVLVVDDEPPIRRMAELMVEMCGHEAILASNPTEALEIFNQEKFDALFTDNSMPTPNQGLELAYKIRQQSDTIYIALISGELFELDDLRKYGIDAYARKPAGLPVYKMLIDQIQNPIRQPIIPE